MMTIIKKARENHRQHSFERDGRVAESIITPDMPKKRI